MRVLVSGAGGLVGSELTPALERAGHSVVRLVRTPPKGENEIQWDPMGSRLDAAALEAAGIDGVVHLAGENIADGRWSEERKQRIRDSRVKGTRLLASTLARLARPPGVLVSASATGFYGSRGDEVLTEDSPSGSDFLSAICRDWEAATAPAEEARVRVVHARFGIILSPRGGALAKMLPPFQMGAGGPFGSGRQWMSWIALEDAVGAVLRSLMTEELRGPVNVVAPNAVRNAEFAQVLGKVLGRPAIIPTPAFALRLLLGEMADALLLSGQHVRPERLIAAGFAFRYPELEGALRHLLGK